ncbi:MAG TPA: flagellar assembly protein FliW [Fimbriimonadaceae bacterium]|nr:flagellar assembly protein FliW [Fimbriimonadaceae bacterium]HRJ96691.1 flagellar assembly protein FliW [Fimbriimonadaceae bacterium]
MTTTTNFTSTRFGEVAYTDADIVTLEGGLLGFPASTSYLILAHKEGSPFRWLQSLEEPGLAFLVVDPAHFVDGYAPLLGDEAAQALGLSEDTPRLVYTIVTIPNGRPEEMTINLAGPIVINGVTRVARQLVIEDPNCAIKHRVLENKSKRLAA